MTVCSVDVEKEREHVQQQASVAADRAHRGAQPRERAADGVGGALPGQPRLAEALAIGSQQRDGECCPPYPGDDERRARGNQGRDAQQARSRQNQPDAQDERHGGADVAPGVSGRADAVHALIGGDVGQHGVVEGHRRVQANGAQHVHHQERDGSHGDGLRKAQHQPGQKRSQEELDLVAGVVGKRAQDGHQQRNHQAGHGLRGSPGADQLAGRRACASAL